MLATAVLALLSPLSAHADKTADFYQGSTAYMDHLKQCVPFDFSYPHPLIKSFTAQNIIKGKVSNACHVIFIQPNNTLMDCLLSQDAINVLTAPKKYQEVRNRQLIFSNDSAESQYMQKECKISINGKQY